SRKGSHLSSDFSGCGISGSMYKGGYRATLSSPFLGIIRNALHHQQGAQVGIAQTKCAEIVRLLGNGPAWELCHVNRDFENQRPHPASRATRIDIEAAGSLIEKPHQI